jgi:hypothetical protein
MTIGQAEGKSIAGYVTAGIGALDAAAGWLSGSSSLVDYNGGSVNTTALGLKATDYKDPSSDDIYKIWVAGSSFELAATMESYVNGGKAARVLGNFRSRDATAVTSSTWSIIKIDAANIGIFKVWDYVKDGGTTPVLTTITNISADGTTITLTDAIAYPSIALQNAEVGWLVGDITDAKKPVTDKSTTLFPYAVN